MGDAASAINRLKEKILVDGAHISTTAQILSGVGIAVGLVFVLYQLATNQQNGWKYLLAWIIAVLFVASVF
jgi:hypothetical protein